MVGGPLKGLVEVGWLTRDASGIATNFAPGGTPSLAALASELVDWRLVRHLQGRDVEYDLPPTDAVAEAAEAAAPAPVAPAATLALWHEYPRDRIAPLFGAVFNTGAWNAGIVVLKEALAMILLVTMDKGSLASGNHYADRFDGPSRFIWQTQTSTRRDDAGGRIISGDPGWSVHLFVRKSKVRDGRGAPFRYMGPVTFAGWEGQSPITVQWDLSEPVPRSLRELYVATEGTAACGVTAATARV